MFTDEARTKYTYVYLNQYEYNLNSLLENNLSMTGKYLVPTTYYTKNLVGVLRLAAKKP